MSLIYEKTLDNDNLLVDANLVSSGLSFNYLKYIEDPSIVDLITPRSDNPSQNYLEYQFFNSGYTMIPIRVLEGWTAEFIINGTQVSTPSGATRNVLFYMGKVYNGNLTGTTTSGETIDFIDNNLTFYLDENNKLVFRSVRYKLDCNNCDGGDDEIQPQIFKTHKPLIPTGNTFHHIVIVFERYLAMTSHQLTYQGANLDCNFFPNNHWYDGEKFRKGRYLIYRDGLLIEIIENVEEVVFRNTTYPLPFVQGWGMSDDSSYYLSNLYEVSGYFQYQLYRGRFYDIPLGADVIKINFDIFSELYGIINPLASC